MTASHGSGVQSDRVRVRARQRAGCQSAIESGLSGNTGLRSVACVIPSNQEVISRSESDRARNSETVYEVSREF